MHLKESASILKKHIAIRFKYISFSNNLLSAFMYIYSDLRLNELELKLLQNFWTVHANRAPQFCKLVVVDVGLFAICLHQSCALMVEFSFIISENQEMLF